MDCRTVLFNLWAVYDSHRANGLVMQQCMDERGS